MGFDKLPFEVVEADQEIRNKHFPNSRLLPRGYWVGPKKYFVLPTFKDFGLEIYNFQARKDDVYLMGYIRTGTTLHCEMVWLIGNDLDYEAAQQQILDYRFPHVDYTLLPERNKDLKVLDDIKSRQGKRFIKSHMPLSISPPSILESGAKIIYCARNPKDTIVSGYHIFRFSSEPPSSFEEYFRMFKNNWNCSLPYFEHAKEAWERRKDPNFLFIFYEDTIKDKRATIRRVASFLEKNLTEEQVDQLLDHLDFQNFKKNKSVNLDHLVKEGKVSNDFEFIRKGGSGGWRDYFTGDLEREVNEWIEENLKDTDLRFPET